MRLHGRTRTAVVVTAALALLAPAAGAQPVDVTLPGTDIGMDEFLEYRDASASTPEGGAAVFILAMLLFEADPNLGHDALVVALDARELRSDPDGYRGFTLGNRASDFVSRYLDPRPYLARSYVMGTSPDNSYALPGELVVGLSRNASSVISDTRVKVFVACSGADSARPITLERNSRGVWKAYEYSSLFVGIRPPVEVEDDPL